MQPWLTYPKRMQIDVLSRRNDGETRMESCSGYHLLKLERQNWSRIERIVWKEGPSLSIMLN